MASGAAWCRVCPEGKFDHDSDSSTACRVCPVGRIGAYQTAVEWHLAPVQSVSCDTGVQASIDQCEAAVAQIAATAGETPARTLQI
eukprot:SAG22_NODE_12113_length_456_cov_0.574230_1_plen_85_part_01